MFGRQLGGPAGVGNDLAEARQAGHAKRKVLRQVENDRRQPRGADAAHDRGRFDAGNDPVALPLLDLRQRLRKNRRA